MNPPAMAAWNLALRFGLELAALAGLAVAGWQIASGPWRWVGALALPVVAAIAWGTFNVAGDPSRSGAAPVPVSGGTRLTIELAVLAAGSIGLLLAGSLAAGSTVALLVVVHYAASLPRLGWLLQH